MTARANAEVASVAMKLTIDEKLRIVREAATAWREVAVLWFTFALLDRYIAGTITLPWVIVNTVVTVAMWMSGIYLDVRLTR